MGSVCIRGQGETDSLFVGLIREGGGGGAKAYTASNQLQPELLNLSQTY